MRKNKIDVKQHEDGLWYLYRADKLLLPKNKTEKGARRAADFWETKEYAILCASDGSFHPVTRFPGGKWSHLSHPPEHKNRHMEYVYWTLEGAKKLFALERIEDYDILHEDPEIYPDVAIGFYGGYGKRPKAVQATLIPQE